MSMMCTLCEVSPTQIDLLRAQPDLAGAVVAAVQDEDAALRLQRMTPPQRGAFEAARRDLLANMQAAGSSPPAAPFGLPKAFGPMARPLDLQKSWHILHYLFTGHIDGSDGPGAALMTGEPLGPDVGYGPARLHGVKETRAFDAFLQATDLARLEARADYAQMSGARIYGLPMGSDGPAAHAEEIQREVAWCFPALASYMRAAAGRGDGFLIWLS
ncbi:MAG TPA: DUF1877 family protein [Caulobacteraceae bacterium]|nr:DUF1877 family protein [Caulobacteraceae bacterium]